MKKGETDFSIIDSSQRHLAAQMFQPSRLVLARELNGISKSELAEQIGKTPSAITQFENGMKPDASTLFQMALALGMPISFFTTKLRVKKIASESCHYRSLRATGIRERRQLQARGTLIHELISWVEEIVAWQKEQISSLSTKVKSVDEIEALAIKVRQSWRLGMGPISNMLLLLENKGVLITTIPSSSKNVDAFSTWSQSLPIIFLVSENRSATRKRFDAAHELGHLIMHADVHPGDMDLEREANRFASAFLLPKEAFLNEFPNRVNWDVLFDLKKRWKVSVQAILRRALDLSLISGSTYKRAMIHLSQNGLKMNEPFEPPHESPQLLQKIMSYVKEECNYSNEEIANHLGLNASKLNELL